MTLCALILGRASTGICVEISDKKTKDDWPFLAFPFSIRFSQWQLLKIFPVFHVAKYVPSQNALESSNFTCDISVF